MKLFVTGGAGFIGSVFTTMALDGVLELPEVDALTVYDALTYAGTLTNLTGCVADPRFTFIRGDICDEPALRHAMRGHDMVIHIAAESHVDRSINGATTFAHTNVVGTAAVMQAAHDVGVSRVVHVSTDEVYGSIPEGAWPETDPLCPTSPYSASKAGSDLVAQAFFRSFALPVIITRCSNNYGPHQFPEKLIPLFVTNLMGGKKVPVYGDGSARRDWLHVTDHCRGLALALTKGRPGEVYNIGGGTELTALQMAQRIVALMGVGENMIDFVADRPGHDMRYCVDDSKARAELGYCPRMSFEQGLADTIDWYRTHRAWWEPLRAGAPRLERLERPTALPGETGQTSSVVGTLAPQTTAPQNAVTRSEAVHSEVAQQEASPNEVAQ